MNPEHFFCMGLGALITLAVQYYGRRKVRQAIAAPDVEARRDIQLLDAENVQRIGQIDRLQERRMEIEASKVAEKAAQYAAQTERLEERVRVLERIVTDRGADLAQEIEALRDERPAARLPIN